MKTPVILLCLSLFLAESGVRAQPDFAPGSRDGTVAQFQTRQGKYTWNISADRFYGTPEWTPEAQPIPVSLDKACQLGKGWLAKHHLAGFSLDEVKLCRYPDAVGVALWYGKAKRRFYYKLKYRSESPDMDFMYVYVLLDGTVVEPKLTPTPDKKS